jgi:hypothetical protein
MMSSQATSAEDFKLVSSFETVRKALLDGKYADRMEKPLAYWALPNDRRLPLAFLGRPLGQLLATPFDELTATKGIGQKKISSLVKLLKRATSDEPPAVPFGLDELTDVATECPASPTEDSVLGEFDAATVSEALWERWREVLVGHEMESEKLGRLAPSLRSLPTVIWHTPLNQYLHHSLSEIRQLRTHGEKRIAVVLQVVHSVYQMLSRSEGQNHLAVRILPKFIPPVERWIDEMNSRSVVFSRQEARVGLAIPLLTQIRKDAGETVHRLAEGRLGILTEPQSVRAQSRDMGVTRARVYQLLEECSKVMHVRWPEGRERLAQLADRFHGQAAPDSGYQLFDLARDLFFPHSETDPDEHNGNGHSDEPSRRRDERHDAGGLEPAFAEVRV